jgi:hypothetical protein
MPAFEYDETVTLSAQFRESNFIDMMQHLIIACVLYVVWTNVTWELCCLLSIELPIEQFLIPIPIHMEQFHIAIGWSQWRS